MKVHEFQTAAVAAIRGRSWADACREVAASLSLGDAGAMLAEAELTRHDAHRVLFDKLTALGAQRLDWFRCYEVRLDAWWYLSPTIGVCYCRDAQPSPARQDWCAEGDPDPALPEGLQVQVLADDVTLVLTTGDGGMVFRTSKRVPPLKGAADGPREGASAPPGVGPWRADYSHGNAETFEVTAVHREGEGVAYAAGRHVGVTPVAAATARAMAWVLARHAEGETGVGLLRLRPVEDAARLSGPERDAGWSGLWIAVVDAPVEREAVRVLVRRTTERSPLGRSEWEAIVDHPAARDRQPEVHRDEEPCALLAVLYAGAAWEWRLVSLTRSEGE